MGGSLLFLDAGSMLDSAGAQDLNGIDKMMKYMQKAAYMQGVAHFAQLVRFCAFSL